jgi:outer membrane protein assembly factor BamD (BamD/ComL family)
MNSFKAGILTALLLLALCQTSCSNPERDFKSAVQANTEQAYQDFLRKHPNSPLASEAQFRIEKNAYEAARSVGTVAAFQEFLTRFSAGQMSRNAAGEMEQMELSAAQKLTTINGWKAFLQKYEQSTNANLARQTLERLEYEAAFRNNEIAAFEGVLAKYPESEYASEATKRLAAHRVAAICAEWGRTNAHQTLLYEFRKPLSQSEMIKLAAPLFKENVKVALVGVFSTQKDHEVTEGYKRLSKANDVLFVMSEHNGNYTLFSPDGFDHEGVTRAVPKAMLPRSFDRDALALMEHRDFTNPPVVAFIHPEAVNARDFEDNFHSIFGKLANHFKVGTTNFALFLAATNVPPFIRSRALKDNHTFQEWFQLQLDESLWAYDKTSVKMQPRSDGSLTFAATKFSMPVKSVLTGTVKNIFKDQHSYVLAAPNEQNTYTVKVSTPIAGAPQEIIITYKGLLTGHSGLSLGGALTNAEIFGIADTLHLRVEIAESNLVTTVNMATFDTTVKSERVTKALATAVENIVSEFTGKVPPELADSKDARDRMENFSWRQATNVNTVKSVERYLASYATGRFAAEARGRMEELIWARAKNANTIRSYLAYERNHPQGRYLADSKARREALRVDESLYSLATRQRTEGGFAEFLTDFPGHTREIEAQTFLKEMTDGRDIVDLLAERKIEIESNGGGIQSVNVRIRRLVSYPLTVRVPVGTYFVAANQSSQNMVITAESKTRLKGDDWRSLPLSAACANRPKGIPNSKDTFTVQRSSNQAELTALMPVLDRANASFPVRQAAVWIVTDNASYSDLGILTSRPANSGFGGGRTIRHSDAAAGMKICSESGIDIKRKQIWHDKNSILSELPDGDLKQWLNLLDK